MVFEEISLATVREYVSIFGENPFIQALVVLLFSFVLAKLTDWLVTRGLSRVTSRTRSDLDDELIRQLHRPIANSVILAGAAIALSLIQAPAPIPFIGFGLIKTLVILIWMTFAIRVSLLVLDWMTRHPERFTVVQPATRPLFEIGAKIVLVGAASYFFLISWGIDPTGWLASAGIAGIAVGFAARDTLANLFAGVFILADAPYKVGDFIVLDTGERGKVTKIGVRSTRILTRNDVEIIVPNSAMGNSKIINESGGPWPKMRLQVPIGVAYGSDSDQVKEVLLGITRANEKVSREPEPWVQFNSFGDSALIFEIRCWIDDPADRGRVLDRLHSDAYKALAKAGIEIPYPKRDVYIKEWPSPLARASSGGDPEEKQ